jgi:hypothetical protein
MTILLFQHFSILYHSGKALSRKKLEESNWFCLIFRPAGAVIGRQVRLWQAKNGIAPVMSRLPAESPDYRRFRVLRPDSPSLRGLAGAAATRLPLTSPSLRGPGGAAAIPSLSPGTPDAPTGHFLFLDDVEVLRAPPEERRADKREHGRENEAHQGKTDRFGHGRPQDQV